MESNSATPSQQGGSSRWQKKDGIERVRRQRWNRVDSESLIMSMCTVVRDYLKKGNKFKFVLYLVLSHRERARSNANKRRTREPKDRRSAVAAAAAREVTPARKIEGSRARVGLKRTDGAFFVRVPCGRLSYTSPHMQDRCCDKFYTFLHIFGKCVVVSLSLSVCLSLLLTLWVYELSLCLLFSPPPRGQRDCSVVHSEF